MNDEFLDALDVIGERPITSRATRDAPVLPKTYHWVVDGVEDAAEAFENHIGLAEPFFFEE